MDPSNAPIDGHKAGRYTFIRQVGENDCGVACLRMILAYYEGEAPSKIKRLDAVPGERLSIYDLCATAADIDYQTNAVKVAASDLHKLPYPLIAYLNHEHYVVVWDVSDDWFTVADPKRGPGGIHRKTFLKLWCDENSGIAILIKPDGTAS